jgi:hypothetical protein
MTIQVDNFDVNDIILRMKPNFSDKGKWNGYIDMEIITDNKHTMHKDDYIQLMQVASLVCSSLPVMEINEEFRDILCDYVESMIEHDDKVEKNDIIKKSIANATGNIIKVNFERSN